MYTQFNTYFTIFTGASRGKITLQTEEVADSKFNIALRLSATKLDKKDFFGKVSIKMTWHIFIRGHGTVISYVKSQVEFKKH